MFLDPVIFSKSKVKEITEQLKGFFDTIDERTNHIVDVNGFRLCQKY